jgi:hypothetical protein
LPDAIEECREQLTALGRVVFELPDAAEVSEQLLGILEPRITEGSLPWPLRSNER